MYRAPPSGGEPRPLLLQPLLLSSHSMDHIIADQAVEVDLTTMPTVDPGPT